MTRAVVVGAGISGLAAARGLADAGLEVIVLESSPRCGGKISTIILDGVALDGGAESVLARRPEALALLDAVGLGPQRVTPTSARPELVAGGAVHSLPRSVSGVPTAVADLDGVLTPAGLARATAETPLPPGGGDLPIGVLVDRQLGPEVTDRLVEPLLGGVYAGHARQLSLAAVSPGLASRVAGGGLLTEHARTLAEASPPGATFAGVVGGIGTLVDALLVDLARRGVEVRTGATVQTLDTTSSGAHRLAGNGPAGRFTVDADAVVLATPAAALSRLLGPELPEAAALGELTYASVAIITFVLRGLDAATSGLLVAPGELPTIKAVTYSSTKWDWVAARARDAWVPDVTVARVSVGRYGETAVLQLPDADLLARTFAEARALAGWERAEQITGVVQRWGGSLPQYPVGHRDRIAGLRAELAERPGLAVCGAVTDGVGIAACVASANTAVTKVLGDLGRDGR